jgi:hypothetical protein
MACSRIIHQTAYRRVLQPMIRQLVLLALVAVVPSSVIAQDGANGSEKAKPDPNGEGYATLRIATTFLS